MAGTLKDQAAIVGIGQTKFTKNSGVSELSLAVECVAKAIEDAGLEPQDIDEEADRRIVLVDHDRDELEEGHG